MRFWIYAGLAVLVSSGAQASLLHQESFESAPGGTYTLSNQIDDGASDFFNRYAVPDNSNVARDDYQSGWDGSYGILGQDHDGAGFAATQSALLSNIAIGGYKALSVTVALGALNSEPNFFNFEASQGDGIKVFYTIDAGAKMLLADFAPPASGAGDLRLDTNADAIGDGAGLTVALSDFTFSIPDVGTSLTLEFELTSTESFETLAMDNVRVNGTSIVPVPASLGLLASGFGLVGFMRWRNRAADVQSI